MFENDRKEGLNCICSNTHKMLDSTTYDPHRPKAIHELVGNTDTWTTLAKDIGENKTSHLVLVGPTGCGKSIFLRLALAEFLTLTIDCTANVGLRDTRDSIRTFGRGGKTPNGNLRWIIFEHADSLAADTQAFLRRMLETTSATTRIVFECRDAGAISEPILSRSSIVAVNAPDTTEINYELQRRTEYKLKKELVSDILQRSYGNMRIALLNGFAALHCESNKSGLSQIQELLATRPSTETPSMAEWVSWAIRTETVCRQEGYDLRDILRLGWPTHPVVANTCTRWSRLGGTSPRTLFFDCIASLLRAV